MTMQTLAPREATRDAQATGQDALRVFIVENHDDTRELLRMLLEALGHTVDTAATMHEALRRLPASASDVLISDIGLADGDGWELLRRLRLTEPIYAIAISGFGMSADITKSREAGYRHHLVKPYGIEQLPVVLREAARERAARRAGRAAI